MRKFLLFEMKIRSLDLKSSLIAKSLSLALLITLQGATTYGSTVCSNGWSSESQTRPDVCNPQIDLTIVCTTSWERIRSCGTQVCSSSGVQNDILEVSTKGHVTREILCEPDDVGRGRWVYNTQLEFYDEDLNCEEKTERVCVFCRGSDLATETYEVTQPRLVIDSEGPLGDPNLRPAIISLSDYSIIESMTAPSMNELRICNHGHSQAAKEIIFTGKRKDF